jgi:hypothetical protein
MEGNIESAGSEAGVVSQMWLFGGVGEVKSADPPKAGQKIRLEK